VLGEFIEFGGVDISDLFVGLSAFIVEDILNCVHVYIIQEISLNV